MDLILEALGKGQSTLSEVDAKCFLATFGIQVVQEVLSPNPEHAAQEARGIGFPVVVKASGAGISHKTEVGGVALNLGSEEQVREAGRRLIAIDGCEALLVQEMVPGQREFICGMIHDDQFGPCVMFGLGGVMTEVLDDIVFRVAPLDPDDAQEMVEGIRARGLLGPFRCESAVQREALIQTLIALGEIGCQHPEVREVDINPLKITPEGKPVAVDALVVIKTVE
jgi:succinyl-CoA synthetase beta subunit